MKVIKSILALLVLPLLAGVSGLHALEHGFTPEEELRIREAFSKSLEELVEMEVTSVTGIEHEWIETPAAVHVITGEDIRRSGHRHLAEILRMAPGMNVGRIDSWHWAVTARTFNDVWVGKQLVLVDGREIYGQWFSGVFWEFEDLPIDLIDKIEIIRGPGATVWGINAMNGVINIKTKKAADIDGTTVTGGFGTDGLGFGEFVRAGELDIGGNYSIWGRFNTTPASISLDGSDSHDSWNSGRVGIRADFGREGRYYSLLADYFQGSYEAEPVSPNLTELDFTSPTFTKTTVLPAYTGNSAAETLNLQLMAGGLLDNGVKWDLNTFYFTRYHDHLDNYGIRLEEDTFAIDLRANYVAGAHNLMFGTSYRYQHLGSTTKVHPDLTFIGATKQSNFPEDQQLDTYQGFLQDTINLGNDLNLMVGTKFENNEYTGSEWLPGARLWWTGVPNRTLWASASKAVRMPSFYLNSGEFTLHYIQGELLNPAFAGLYLPYTLYGNEDLGPEVLKSYEIGWREQLRNDLVLDATAFIYDYEDLLLLPQGDPGAQDLDLSGPLPALRRTFSNNDNAEAYGIEGALSWQATEQWKIDASYSWTRFNPGGPNGAAIEGIDPEHKWQVRSTYELRENLDLHQGLYFVDEIPRYNIDSYLRLDLGMTWRPNATTELGFWGQNLLESTHEEYHSEYYKKAKTGVGRSFYITVRKKF